MAKPRATTISQRFGFKDPELSTSKHDEILFWVEANQKRLAAKCFQDEIVQGSCRDAAIKRWQEMRVEPELRDNRWVTPSAEELKLKAIALRDAVIPERPLGEIRTKWECAIMDRRFTVGFIDMVMSVRFPTLWAGDNGLSWSLGMWHEIAIEAKTRVGSMGELLRQIRMYQEHKSFGHWVLVSPPIPYEAILKKEGVDFWLYAP